MDTSQAGPEIVCVFVAAGCLLAGVIGGYLLGLASADYSLAMRYNEAVKDVEYWKSIALKHVSLLDRSK